MPVLRAHVRAKVVFDGAAGNPASFDNKAFAKLVLEGGVVRVNYLMHLVATEPGFDLRVEMAKEYVKAFICGWLRNSVSLPFK
ncbi:MAG: hypothetical protein OXE85_09065 [Roseovarius sp.]|nr:hypothetical protein [Roseovarius sp.]